MTADVPSDNAVTTPLLFTPATVGTEDDHTISPIVALEGVTSAVNWVISPILYSIEEGLSVTDETGTSCIAVWQEEKRSKDAINATNNIKALFMMVFMHGFYKLIYE